MDQVDSTNDYLKSELSNFKPLAEWTAIMTKNQTKGRGQRENSWLSQPHVNLTFSFFILPTFLNLQQQFLLNVLVSLGIIDWLNTLKVPAKIKWPNDVYIGHKKIGGVLIENKGNSKSILQSVIGIGINVNQMEFPAEILQKASSIKKETGIEIQNLEEACRQLRQQIFNSYQRFLNKKQTVLETIHRYNENLLLKNEVGKFESDGIPFEALLDRVEPDGRLILIKNGKEQEYLFKEVTFLLQ